ncbi:MAG: ABC transporter substrate-binding protein [Acidobacteria bacterium]|nr:ABC transporter substrate-binding protein [Acidobacteriota bacterium]
MNFPRSRVALLAVCLVTAGGLSCRDPEPVVLGAVYNLSGDQASLDGPSSRGAQLAVDEANRAGGLLGRPVELVLVDGETSPEVIRKRTTELLAERPRTAAVFGLSDTDMVLAAAPVAAAAGRVFVTSGATSPELPAEVPGFLFLACFGDNVQAAAGAEWAYGELGSRQVVVLYDGAMTYTQLLHRYFEERFGELGGEIVLSRPYDRSNPEPALEGLPMADLYYLASGPEDAVSLTRALRAHSVAAPVLGGDSFDEPAAWQAYPEAEAVYFTTHAAISRGSTDPAVQAFVRAYEGANDGQLPDAFAALGYDTVNLLLRAIGDAGSDDPAAVLGALARISDFVGVTGSLSFPAGERIPRKSVSILEVDDGSTHLVRQLVPKAVPAPAP